MVHHALAKSADWSQQDLGAIIGEILKAKTHTANLECAAVSVT